MIPAIPLELHRTTEPVVLERVRVRAQRLTFWFRHAWAKGAASIDQGLAITHAEVDRLLRQPERVAAESQAFYAADPAVRALSAEIVTLDQRAGQDREWQTWCRCFGLSQAESDLLALALAAELEPGLRRVYAYLHDEVQATHASPWLAAQLFDWPQGTRVSADSNLVRFRLARPLDGLGQPWSALASWAVDPSLVASFGTGSWRDPLLDSAIEWITGSDLSSWPTLQPEALDEMRQYLASQRGAVPTPVEIDVIGPAGSGRCTLSAQLTANFGRDLLVADAAVLIAPLGPGDAADRVIRVLRLARASGAIPYWRNAESVPAAIWRSGQGLSDLVLYGRESPSSKSGTHHVERHSVALSPLSPTARDELWKSLCANAAPPFIHEHRLSVSEVVAIARAASGGDVAMRRVCSDLLRPPEELLHPLVCPYTWDDLVLTPNVHGRLKEFEQQARLRWSVYEDWGFGRLCPLGRGITALFAGPSGTGKTMSAQVIARSLGLDLYRVDLASVVNKYIGETEKKLRQVFDLCDRASVLLFFDEADALFGQRTQVKDAHDRFANIEIDYLLQRMEQFDGVAVLATNRSNDLDPAFLRRLRFSIDFLLPGPVERLNLWQRALLPTSPKGEALLDNVDWAFLAEKLNLTGAGIKAATLGAAFLANGEGCRISMRHIVSAARRELTKHGQTLRPTPWEGKHEDHG